MYIAAAVAAAVSAGAIAGTIIGSLQKRKARRTQPAQSYQR